MIDNDAAIDVSDENWESPLHLAAKHSKDDSTELIEILIENSKSLGFLEYTINETNNEGLTPVMLAATKGHTKIVKYLVSEGADLMSSDTNDQNLLHLASKNGKTDMIRALFKKNFQGIEGGKVCRLALTSEFGVFHVSQNFKLCFFSPFYLTNPLIK